MTDIIIHDHGSICILNHFTDAGAEWCAEHLPDDALMMGDGIVVEPRYVGPIVEGMIDAGLEVGGVDR
jgi:hypothetical protein